MMKFEELTEAWLEDYQKSVKHKTYINAKQAIERHLYPHFAGIAIDEVKSIDVVDVIRNLDRTSTTLGLRCMGFLERMYTYAYIHRITLHDPSHRVKKYLNLRTKRYTRPFLILSDVRVYFDVSLRDPCKPEIAIIFYTMILTVVRLNELVLAKVSDFDFEKGLWYIPAKNTKMNREHIAILPSQLSFALQNYFAWHGSDIAFPDFRDHSTPMKKHTIWDRNNKGGKGRVMLGVHSPHAFRNTFSTYANEEGWNRDYIEVTLAHTTLDIRFIYNKALYLRQRKEMMQWYADEVDKFIDFGKYMALNRFIIQKTC